MMTMLVKSSDGNDYDSDYHCVWVVSGACCVWVLLLLLYCLLVVQAISPSSLYDYYCS